MISFSLSEILLSAVLSLLFGLIGSFVYLFTRSVLKVLLHAKDIIKYEYENRSLPPFNLCSIESNKESAPFQILDFVILTAIFVGFCLLQYACLDGVFRLFLLLFACLPFLALRQNALPLAEKLFDRVLLYIASLLLFGISFVLSVSLPLSKRLLKNAVRLKNSLEIPLKSFIIKIKRLTKTKESGKIDL